VQHARQASCCYAISVADMLKCAGNFFMQKFSKPFTTCHEQLEKLKTRGLIIHNWEESKAFLSYCGYYRFSGYVLPFERERHVLLPNTSFADVKKLYEFDRNLRYLVSEAIAVIEISMRSRIAYELGRSDNPFLHRNKDVFQRKRHSDWNECYEKIIEETKRSQELFVKHYKEKYAEYPHLPIWVLTELISFGSLSKFYACLLPQYQKAVSEYFGVPHVILVSWLHTLTHIRNLCAHHSRLWDRQLSVPPKTPKSLPEFQCFRNEVPVWRLFFVLSVIKFLLGGIKKRTNVDIDWSNRIISLLDAHPPVPNFDKHMGLPSDWKQMELWR
jgi:abortive infection bacteriophage resistance protein